MKHPGYNNFGLRIYRIKNQGSDLFLLQNLALVVYTFTEQHICQIVAVFPYIQIMFLMTWLIAEMNLNPYLMNGFSHHYQLGESTFFCRSDFYFLSHFPIKFLCANRIAPDGMPRSAASHLGLCCLPMSHKKDARLK